MYTKSNVVYNIEPKAFCPKREGKDSNRFDQF